MATAPSPFFYSLPSAYPSAAAYPPPAYDFSPAPQSGYSNFPSAAAIPAYAPYSPSPAFPYAATYPYPPPASAYTPASGSSPNRPTWPPPAPDATPSIAPSTFSSYPTPKSGFPPVQAYDSSNAISSPTGRIAMEPYANEGPCTAETSRTLCTVEKRAGKSGSVLQPATPDFLCQVGDLTKSNDAGRVSTSDVKAVHKHTGPGTLSKANASTSHRFFMEDDAAVQAAADERVPAKNAIRHRRQRKLLNLHARLDEQQARERTAINTLQGQLTKLKLMASHLEISIGKHVSSVHATTALSSSDISAAVSLSASSGCSQFDASATAYVVPHKFSEMPQSYSLHNLNCKSIVRADGTNHSYFTLPEDYPLERDVPAPVFDVYDSDGCSNEFVHVFSSTPEQQSYEEEEEQDSEQLLKCVGKAPETEHTPKYFSNPSENEIPSQPPMSATDQMQFETFESTP